MGLIDRLREARSRRKPGLPGLSPIPGGRIDRAAGIIQGAGPYRADPWSPWIAALPEEDRAKGARACRVWREMLALRKELQGAIAERKALSGILEDEARRVMEVRMFALRGRIERCEAAYREVAEPFFAKHGRPPVEETRSV